ncbi:condensin subunit Smc [Tranquillimonas rosea]|uniref:Chromosome partition protein Smc n=1 Tax=Tranquillimonas rosea TaxID=641238 RepID=A0A1H9W5D7_9RHOB|nr:chromosome segregation protein SMC [Tranquillimonas rosea]SES29132.1 condensin subunit Smc [Tranquillimonas rosea]
MRFTRLRLTGFKSFVDPTDLVIADGLTGVVGPNGCGKSNLLEALRWVMGENRPTAMRGGGMEDVIFAGTATRGAKNFAEVSLAIDNGQRLAPAGFNDSDTLDIVRRITRDAGSAFKVNAKDVRARDVQMLFADASTGAQSPALVRQGQISELINAKPKARRRILEDAAGIAGLYQRRHEAELKLKGAETNLERVSDTIEQLAQQLSTLTRQARQAKRYREIGGELRRAEGLLLYRRWCEAVTAETTAEGALAARADETAAAERAVRDAEAAREAAEGALPPLREEDSIAAAVLQRLQVEREGLEAEIERARAEIASLESRIAQLDKDAARESALDGDAGESIGALETEAAELRAAGEGHDDRVAEAADRSAEAADILGQRESDLGQLTEDAARLSARHQSARRRVDDAHRDRDKADAAARQAEEAAAAAEETLAEKTRAAETAAEAQEAAVELAERAEETLTEADAARSEAQASEADARAARSEAEGEAKALAAEIGALERLVARDDSDEAQILDSVAADPGYEAALGAALADDLRAPEIGPEGVSGWARLAPYGTSEPLPEGATPLSDVVRVPEVLARRIDHVGLVARADGARSQAALRPGQRLVSAEGDLWRWDGFRAGAEDAPSAAALRLQQMNRLAELRQQGEVLDARVESATEAHSDLSARLKDLTEADRTAREARRAADARVTETTRAQNRAEADRDMAAGKLETQRAAIDRHAEEARAARAAVEEAEMAQRQLDNLDDLRERVEEAKTSVEAARITMMSARAAHDELARDGEARSKRLRTVESELAGWQRRRESAGQRLADLSRRRDEAARQLEAAQDRPVELAERGDTLARDISQAEERRDAAVAALSSAEEALRAAAQGEREATATAGEAREARARAEATAEAAREATRTARERISEELDTTPEALAEALEADADALPPVDKIEAEIARLRRARDSLGAVNLRAEEDAEEVRVEHDQLSAEKTDLEEAIATLRQGIAGLNKEGRERLLAAFEQVNENFAQLFTHLFGGGHARLELVESDDPLDAGLEILCSPPGKKLSTLSLLSGGEQTLTALALIFGVFMANPAPICVLDEVDAPLDDANVTRFCDLLDEMTRRTDTRFLIITHHAVTMARMDRLFGVTMGERGVSQLVSVDLRRAEAMVA